ncbi:endonuclease/exonuclease/phosphatase family protein [Cyclobacterium jeungdonense]|uniref:Endonuclease/exonuclease/phosphatase family protein n=1 Tax=Cyclobacterium jeungdonense TaxID=708087 RepID=A0ABT8CCE3_9BACT|nr:endonuclease/exonuclease/phosphatase family protein [Cyclobacterium jeungdonense]MDN3690062.1 endonuclease/exonuclease/phosphatase family protein [Cyclobacterium jeungdonense]
MKYVVLIFGFLVILASALPIIHTGTWWIRIFDFPRIQIAVLCLLALALAFYFLRTESRWLRAVFIILLLASLVHQLSKIISFTPLVEPTAKRATTGGTYQKFTLLLSNVLMENQDYDKLKNLIATRNPDLILLTEPNLLWTKALIDLDQEYRHTIKEPLNNTYGMVLLSKFPLHNGKVNYLVENNIPSIFAEIQLPNGDQFDFFGVHPEPPKPGSDTYERDTELLIIGKKIKENPRPVLVAGDLNDVGWSKTSTLFRRYSRLVDPREGRGFFNTYSVFLPLLRYPLDHVFYSNDFGLVRIEKLEPIGSDHFPMWLELTFEPDSSETEEVPKTDQKDKQEVEEKVEKGNEESQESSN